MFFRNHFAIGMKCFTASKNNFSIVIYLSYRHSAKVKKEVKLNFVSLTTLSYSTSNLVFVSSSLNIQSF